MHMSSPSEFVYIVDDDLSVRLSLQDLLSSMGVTAAAFGSIEEFLHSERVDCPSCLVLDVRMPGRSGLEFQQAMEIEAGPRLPIVFITGHGDIPMSVQAMRAGAVDFLTKPFREQDLIDAIRAGLRLDRARRTEYTLERELRAKFASLTMGERSVMQEVVNGRLNKQIAADLGLSEITVKVRRANVMDKMSASSLPDLVRMADRLTAGRSNKAY